jgi:hypothetical protein
MAHPDRAAEVSELLAALDRPVPVHWDDEGPASGNADRVWRTARGAWSLFDPDADRHVLIQDDAIVCADYLAGLEQALVHVPPSAVVSPYLGQPGRVAPARWGVLQTSAERVGASWIRGERVMWGVSLVLPTNDIPAMIDWADRRAGVPDDMRVGGWAKRENREVWYPWPSLVDHRTIASLTKHNAAERVARRHHTGSALDLRWDGPVLSDPMLIRRRGSRSAPSVNRQVS